MQFLATLCNYVMEKTLINSQFVGCLSCLLPNHMANFPEKCGKLFAKILEKRVLYK